MRKMTSTEIRNTWLNFWKSKGHMIEPGASLIPVNDPTLLWINAGVAALKKYFDGSIKPQNNRIANVQKCLRTNDIDNVGLTSRHQTFFEMLGNFSIGDYFRKEAITWGYELLTSPEWFGIDKDKLYFTVHPSDKESRELWLSLGVEESHIVFCEGNFWEIGSGPCGPDSEIFFDRGEKYDPEGIGTRLISDDIENDRYIEIWNIVFSQYNAKEGLKREEYPELPQKNIDTGGGLERFACILQGAETNFGTDLFVPIIEAIEKLAKLPYNHENQMAYHVIADHIRTCTFALADGAMFSNEGRGYVLRRILRRGVRYGKKIGIEGNFMAKLCPVVCQIMGESYPYLEERLDRVMKLITSEEEKFEKTLNAGEQMLLNYLETKPKLISKEVAFKLYDTYGFPLELTEEIAKERGLEVDIEGFKEEMLKQKERARNARIKANSMNRQSKDLLEFVEKSEFFYDSEPRKAKIIALFKDGNRVDQIEENGEVIFDVTNFYAESGGEVADSGYFECQGGKVIVENVQKAPNKQNLHSVDTQGCVLNVGDEVVLHVDEIRRKRIMRNHSACHLLQKALQEVLGNHINQAGSYVDEERARFDFTHFEKISEEQLRKVEERVNEIIDKAYDSKIKYMPIEEAKKTGAMALFGEKYGDIVRVVNFGDWSIEFCGGCHVSNTSDIGAFVIEFEESISSGVRRIQACTGLGAYHLLKKREDILQNIAKELEATSIYEADDRLNSKLKEFKEMKEELVKLSQDKANGLANNIINKADMSKGYPIIIEVLDNVDGGMPLKILDVVKSKNLDYFVFLVNKMNDKVSLLAACSQNLIKQGLHCGKIIQESAKLVQGGGGGRPDMAQAGGKDVSKVDAVINYVKGLL